MPEEPVGRPLSALAHSKQTAHEERSGRSPRSRAKPVVHFAEVGRANGFAPTQKRVPSRLLTKMPGRNAIP